MFLQKMLLRKESIYGRSFTNRGMPHHRPFSFFFFLQIFFWASISNVGKVQKNLLYMNFEHCHQSSCLSSWGAAAHFTYNSSWHGMHTPPLGRCSLKWTWKWLAPKCALAEQPSRKRQKLKRSENIFRSRFNHSCRPLAEFSWNPVRKKQEVRVIR